MPPPLTPLSVCPALLPPCCRAKVSVSLILESFGRNHSGISKPAATKTKQGVIDLKLDFKTSLLGIGSSNGDLHIDK